MKLGYVIYYVEDVKSTLEFYEKAFSLKTKFLHESHTYGELQTGETTLSFANYDLAYANGIGFKKRSKDFQSSDMEIGLVTDNVSHAHQKAIQAGAILVKDPVTKPWGQVVSYVRDLNGFLIEICSPVN